MTSLELYKHDKILNNNPPIDWGTLEARNEKIDPTVIKGPTYLLQNQPTTQYYRENNLELSNVRVNDQLMPGPFKINMLEKQIQAPFPMQHPYTSHMSYNALFPSYTAPEDAKRGEVMLKCDSMIKDVQTPSRVDDTLIIKKTKGFPYRQELQQLQLPTQRRGIWYEDKQYMHVPKPEDQNFYLHPQNLNVPNPRLRPEERSIDLLTANVLKNKERQLMQSTQQADFYKDGLGSQAPLNSDDLCTKKLKYEQTGDINETMKPYFKRGGGISHATLTPNDLQAKSVHFQEPTPREYQDDQNQKKLLTQLEKDERIMETGKEYLNMPESYNINNPTVQTMSALSFGRSNTMPDLTKLEGQYRSKSAAAFPPNKSENDKQKLDFENHDRIQRMIMENRRHDLDLITPDRDLRLLRIKMDELENARGSNLKLNQKQTIKQHINTFYNQEGKYSSERAQLYRTPVYNPYLVKQYIENVKADPKISANHTSNGSANPGQNNVTIPNDAYEHRPKLFAHKVFSDYELLKRGPLEQTLTDPSNLSSINLQENGQTHQQSTYGGSYNTKKFLQEYDPTISKTTLEYIAKDPSELQHQNIVLRSNVDILALKNLKNKDGTSSNLDLHTARNEIKNNEEKIREIESTQYPRTVGPIPPEPYEGIYCAEHAGEMGDGYAKRYYSRVYDSPHIGQKNPRFEALKTDLEAMANYEIKANNDMENNQLYLKKFQEDILRKSLSNETSHIDRSKEKIARRMTDHTSVQFKEQQQPLSTYRANLSDYRYKKTEKCPPNNFYKSADYTETVQMKNKNQGTPKNIISLQDRWSKSLANKLHGSKYQSSMPDLRMNICKGKKRLPYAPNAEQYVA